MPLGYKFYTNPTNTSIKQIQRILFRDLGFTKIAPKNENYDKIQKNSNRGNIMTAIKERELFEEIEVLPLDLKVKIVDKILTNLNGLDESIDNLWFKKALERKNDIENGKVNLIDGNEVFEKVKQRFA